MQNFNATIAGNLQNMQPVQNCKYFIFCSLSKGSDCKKKHSTLHVLYILSVSIFLWRECFCLSLNCSLHRQVVFVNGRRLLFFPAIIKKFNWDNRNHDDRLLTGLQALTFTQLCQPSVWIFLAYKEASQARLSLHLKKCHIVGNSTYKINTLWKWTKYETFAICTSPMIEKKNY